MQQKTIAGAVIAFVAFSLVVFLLYQQQESGPQETDYELEPGEVPFTDTEGIEVVPGSTLDECGTQKTQYERDFCWLMEATSALEPSKCANIEDSVTEINCIRAIAKGIEEDKDAMLAVCNTYLAGNETQKYMCQIDVARELLDPTICDAMPEQPTNYRQHCIQQVALEA